MKKKKRPAITKKGKGKKKTDRPPDYGFGSVRKIEIKKIFVHSKQKGR